MKEFIAVLAGMLALSAGIPYVIDIIRRKTKPNIVTWIIWSTLTIIGTSAAFAAHQPFTAYLTIGDTVANLATVILGLKYGIAKFYWIDGVCFVGAVIGLVLWYIFNSPEIAILAVIIIDLVALVPTLNHSWQKPEEETWHTYAILVIASICTLISLNMFSVASLSYPLYLLFGNGALVAVLIFRRNQLGHKLSR